MGQRAGEYNIFYGKGNENHQLGTGFVVHRIIVTAVKTVEFVSDRLSYIVLRGRWHNINAVNLHASSDDKSDESKAGARTLPEIAYEYVTRIL